MRHRVRRVRAIAVAMLAVLALTVAAVAPAAAIRYGTNDGDAHPFVGIMVAQDAEGDPLWRCTGTLLSDTVFLTAGHCVEAPAAHIEIWFTSGPEPLAAGYPVAGGHPCAGIVSGYPCQGQVGGTPYGHPQWNPNAFWLHDLGVVVLDESHPSSNSVYGELPTLGQLDSLRTGHGTTFTAVGYGQQLAMPDAAAWREQSARIRKVANPWLVQINTPFTGDVFIQLTDNAAAGGTCFGDSGGPNFIGSTNTIAAVNSFVYNTQCAGWSGGYRIDQADDLDWLATFFD
jgi:hypothetical protein